MTASKDLINLIPTMQATALLAENFKDLDFDFKSKKKKSPRLVEKGVKNILGVELIKATAQASSGLS